MNFVFKQGKITQKFFSPDGVSSASKEKLWTRFNETEEFRKNYSNATLLSALLSGVNEGITFYAHEPERRITIVNNRMEQLTGYEKADLIRRPIVPFLVPEMYLEIIEKIKQSESLTSPYDIAIITKERNFMPITVVGAPVLNMQNERVGSMLLMNNDSQVFMKNLEFLSGFIHDMRNALTIALLESNLHPSKIKEVNLWLGSESHNEAEKSVKSTVELIFGSLKTISTASKNMHYLISGLHSFINREKQELKHFSLKGSVVSAISLFKGSRDYKLKSVDIEQEGENNILIYGQEGNFQSILLNILLNAIKEFTDNKGNKITISWKPASEGKISILVSNNGPKIPEHIAKALFKERVQSTHMGAGIGLMNVKAMLENFNGSILLKETSDECTVFEITVEGRRGSSPNH